MLHTKNNAAASLIPNVKKELYAMKLVATY